MSGGNPFAGVKKAIKKAKETVEGATEAALTFTTGGALGQGSYAFDKLTGKKTGAAFNTFATAGKEAAEKLIDQPKAAKEAFKRAAAEAKSMQEAQLKKLEKRRAQEGAESAASDELLRRRARQRRRSGGTGRDSTILTQDLGSVGGSSGGRKNLLGL